jgi:hypothetical protein
LTNETGARASLTNTPPPAAMPPIAGTVKKTFGDSTFAAASGAAVVDRAIDDVDCANTNDVLATVLETVVDCNSDTSDVASIVAVDAAILRDDDDDDDRCDTVSVARLLLVDVRRDCVVALVSLLMLLMLVDAGDGFTVTSAVDTALLIVGVAVKADLGAAVVEHVPTAHEHTAATTPVQFKQLSVRALRERVSGVRWDKRAPCGQTQLIQCRHLSLKVVSVEIKRCKVR